MARGAFHRPAACSCTLSVRSQQAIRLPSVAGMLQRTSSRSGASVSRSLSQDNWPQAWSASSLFSILQAILGIYPYAPIKTLLLDPRLPAWLPEITLRKLRVGRASVDIRFYRSGEHSDFEVLGKRGKLHVLRQPSPWSRAASIGEQLEDLMKACFLKWSSGWRDTKDSIGRRR